MYNLSSASIKSAPVGRIFRTDENVEEKLVSKNMKYYLSINIVVICPSKKVYILYYNCLKST